MKKIFIFTAALLAVTLSRQMTVYAITPADVEAVGRETAAGNVFIWFLCTIAFLKISQKIDSFMSSLGINVGHTGGSMMAELLIAARGVSLAKNVAGGGGYFRPNGSSGTMNHSFLSGGLSGAVGRSFTSGAVKAVTGQSGNRINMAAFDSSVKKGGDFANNVISAVAQGNISYTGSMTGAQASQALTSYLGFVGIPDAPSFSEVEIGGGRIMGTETSVNYPNGTAFGMYHADQYMPPEGSYETVTTADNATWYRQYAADAVERTPYMAADGHIAYRENIIQKLPDIPRRKDRV